MSDVRDAIVVGGGVAGATAATLLAKEGFTTLLVEKDESVKHKVCGEFLSIESQPFLYRLGLNLDEMGAKGIDELQLFAENDCLRTSLPFLARGVSRKKLDESLLQLANQAGAEIKWSTRVDQVKGNPSSGFEVATSAGVFRARMVFWATGKSEVKTVLQREGTDTRYVAFKRHFDLVGELKKSFDRKIELHLFAGGYGGLSQVEGGRVNFCFIIDRSHLKKTGVEWQNLTAHIAKNNSRLSEIFENARWCWERPVTTSSLPYGHIQRNSKPFFVLGDQFAVIPSLAGDGISMAVISAYSAVRHFRNGIEQGCNPKVISDFDQELRDLFLSPMRWGGYLQNLFGSAKLAKLGIRMARPFPGLAENLINKTRSVPLHREAESIV